VRRSIIVLRVVVDEVHKLTPSVAQSLQQRLNHLNVHLDLAALSGTAFFMGCSMNIKTSCGWQRSKEEKRAGGSPLMHDAVRAHRREIERFARLTAETRVPCATVSFSELLWHWIMQGNASVREHGVRSFARLGL